MSTGIESQTRPGLSHVMDLCDFCVEIVEVLSSSDSSPRYHELKRPTDSLCWFCEQLTKRFNFITESRVHTWEPEWRLNLYFTESLMQNEEDLRCYFEIWRGDLILEFAVWADEGTSACNRFVKRPPILGPNTEEAHSLAKFWLTTCLASHESCVSAVPGTLPTRLLQISGEEEAPRVRLVESESLAVARYCALSHCWGPTYKQPLRTMRESYPSHLRNIAYDILPKTFREAIALTRSLSIEYLWIDSLCIIQDDQDDWLSEAGKMAGVYRNATLVISASDAKDSTEGLLVTERKHESVFIVPYISEGMVQGTFKIAQLPSYNDSPYRSHLNTRAWALQERLLARRKIFFTQGGIAWQCDDLGTWERGHHKWLDFVEQLSWLGLLTKYSQKRLTNAGDRLYALQGIAEKIGETRDDYYNTSYGVWGDEGLYEQLLWRQDQPLLETGVLDLPTWTWAATGGSKVWCLESIGDSACESMPRTLQLGSSGALSSSGDLSNVTPTLRPLFLRPWMFNLYLYMHSVNAFLGRYIFLHRGNEPDYLVHVIEGCSGVLGLAVFDQVPSITAKCFFVAKQARNTTSNALSGSGSQVHQDEGIDLESHVTERQYGQTLVDIDMSELRPSYNEVQPNFYEAANSRRTIVPVAEEAADNERAFVAPNTETYEEHKSSENSMDDAKSKDSRSDAAYSEPMSLQDWANIRRISELFEDARFVYWCLLLEPAGEGKYTRVGLAMLYPDAFKALGADLANFEII